MKVGFVIMLVENWQQGRSRGYQEIRSMALKAEEAGFDSIWLYDHLLYEQEGIGTIGIWECWTMLSALAEATERVEIGSLVICNSFRNPAILAKMAHTLDEVSGGRFILGVGAGWNRPEFDAFGVPFDHRVDRFEEAVQIIRPLLKDGVVDFTGKYYQARDCRIIPRGPRLNGPPLLIGAFGPRMLRLAAKYADIWNTAFLKDAEALKDHTSALETACHEAGREFEEVERTLLVVLSYPELGEPPNHIDEYLIGSEEVIIKTLRDYEAAGVSHLMFHCSPYSEEALNLLAQSVEKYRKIRG